MSPSTPRVRSLHRFPVKSMQGQEVESLALLPGGALGDRAYAVVDTADGTVASAKYPRKWGALLGCSAAFLGEPTPDGPPPPVAVTFADGRVLESGAELDAALSELLGRAVALSADPVAGAEFEEQWPVIEGLAPQGFIDDTTVEHSDGEAVSRIATAGLTPSDSFLDLGVLHLMTTSTLAALRAAAPDATFALRRYRPNLLLDTGEEPEFLEDEWVGRTLAAGDARITVTMPTMRCVMTTLAQGDLPQDRDTLRTIARVNRRTIPGMGTWACAGAYADVAESGTVRVGDTLA
ncbi:MOSC domain-containing protein [Pseudonocardia pini]|uniref:MOSC domain-containing protein n=1 Tax=Pseudonocardia pini TaxID=2758030 RepID=UPI0015F0EE75|nr:MOSC N-terminal beta barrel domain-containing protein [Pseudonocardia pini]